MIDELKLDRISYNICKKSISTIKDSSIKLASILTYIDNNKIYQIGKYKSTADFAKKEFDLSKSTVSRLISLMRKFGKKSILPEKIGLNDFDALLKTYPDGFMELKEEYKPYEYSKLALMSQMNEEHLSMVNKDLSVRQIAQVLKAQKDKEHLEDKKKSLDNFEIKADPFWYDNNNIERLFKIGKNQIRSPAQLKNLEQLFKSDSFMEYTEKQKISIFAVLAIKEKIENLKGDKK